MGGEAVKTYFANAVSSWLTPIYLVVLATITVAVIRNILEEEKLSSQIVGALVLIPLVLRLLLIK